MEFYYILIALLLLVAIFDLFVGVSNDAVNFLNSAVGSKAFSFKFLLVIASLGVLFGASFSNGMMDIARHGIFQPEYYTFVQIITIFIAVSLTDVLLLDIFNSLGLPTSTTVSMIFELLGASIAISMFKMLDSNAYDLGQLINTEKALSVIIGIFLSVAIAFTVGFLIQYLTRLAFTFGYKKNLKYFIGVFGGFSLTSIVYFILVKGLKTVAFVPKEFLDWIHSNEALVLVGLFVSFTVLSQLLHILRVNMLKVIIACGTFSLALAFAGNDLVNFVGVSLTGLSSIQHLVVDNGNPDTYLMGALMKSESEQWFFLFIAGIVMVIALVTSKKAKKVIKTSVSLSTQGDTEEVFGTNPVARAIVRTVYSSNKKIQQILPRSVSIFIAKRFNSRNLTLEKEDAAFDLIRASLNLVLASSLIALGTSLKLPLSTTYVTFMVAMGSSLADRAWSRNSAVYRITGVLSVIGGWFLTAFAAFSSAFVFAVILYTGGIPVQLIAFGLVFTILIRSNFFNQKKDLKKDESSERFNAILKSAPDTDVFPLIQKHSREEWTNVLLYSADCYKKIIFGLLNENYSDLKESQKQLKILKKFIERVRRQGTICSRKLNKEDILMKNFFLYQANDFLGDAIFDIEQICTPCLTHVDNNFSSLSKKHQALLKEITENLTDKIYRCANMVSATQFEKYDEILGALRDEGSKIVEIRKAKMLKMEEDPKNLRSDILYLTILYETKAYIDDLASLIKSARKFLTPKPEVLKN